MKVGILTFPNSTSYGASLQMYALYRTIQKMGDDVQIINYFNPYMKSQKHIAKMSRLGSCQRSMTVLAMKMLHCRQYAGFRRFENRMLKNPRNHISDKDRLPNIGKSFDAIICGSDQVWNPDITDRDLSFFLDFCGPETRRIAYAPSFGVEELPEDYALAVKKELLHFSNLSVREISGQKIVQELSGRDAQLVVDPTLLLDSSEWEQCEKAHPAAKGDYILFFTVRSSETLWQYCLDLAQEQGLKILRIGSNRISKFLKKGDWGEYVCDVSPDEWLYLMHHARYIVTNSFHGTAFAINYRKDFFVEFSSLTNSRLSNIVKLLGLEDQIVQENGKKPALKTDYSCTDQMISQLKAESLDYLIHALAHKWEEYE